MDENQETLKNNDQPEMLMHKEMMVSCCQMSDLQ